MRAIKGLLIVYILSTIALFGLDLAMGSSLPITFGRTFGAFLVTTIISWIVIVSVKFAYSGHRF